MADNRDTTADRLTRAEQVIRLEARTIDALVERLSSGFPEAVQLVLDCGGMVIVTGMGKAGLVGSKLSATLASTGTPSIALHPTEAMHGDLGRIRRNDLVIALSNSGETQEVKGLLPHLRRIGARVIALTGAPQSSVARLADCVLDIGPVDEACPLGLAPTASTSAMMALGDALAMVVAAERGFSRDDYAAYHPGGSLGRRLMRVNEVMRTGEELPLVALNTPVRQVILTMSRTQGRPGAALVVEEDRKLVGIFTDGDLRRLLEHAGPARIDEPVQEFMGREPKTVRPDSLMADAERIRHRYKIDQIAVIDEAGRAVGLLDVQDLLDTRT